MFYEISDMSEGYLAVLDDVRTRGRERAPRGMKTRELPNVLIKLTDPYRNHPVDIGRAYGQSIVAAEALSLVGGVSDPLLMIACGSAFTRFIDGGTLHGAYGPRIRGQLPAVVQKLREDPDTRQAILSVWDARYDQAGWTPKDLPCTLSIGFAIFDEKLECNVTMRSNDAWLGLAHDVPMFTCLQHTVASALEIGVGPYYHLAHSMHVYERDFDAIDEQVGRPYEHDVKKPWEETPLSPAWGVHSAGDIEIGMQRARAILAGEFDEDFGEFSTSESWYAEQLMREIGVSRGAREYVAENSSAKPAILDE